MTTKNDLISKGFILSGLMNMTVLILSKFFNNPVIPKYDSIVMAKFGLLMIVICGLVYISTANNFERLK